MATRPPTPSVLAEPVARARLRLDSALRIEADAGRLTPCQSTPREFTADGYGSDAQRAAAAALCSSGPVLDVCHDFAETTGERWHVWSGDDRA